MEIEDHATNASLTVRTTAAALDLLESLLAIEALLARDVVSLSRSWLRLGAGTEPVVRAIETVLAEAREDRSPAAIHEVVRDEVLRRLV
jgi:histidine ammonia-lyase